MLMMEYIVDADYNDGYTAPELQREIVALMSKLNPRPLVRCRDCKRNQEDCPMHMNDPDGYCSLGELRCPPCR